MASRQPDAAQAGGRNSWMGVTAGTLSSLLQCIAQSVTCLVCLEYLVSAARITWSKQVEQQEAPLHNGCLILYPCLAWHISVLRFLPVAVACACLHQGALCRKRIASRYDTEPQLRIGRNAGAKVRKGHETTQCSRQGSWGRGAGVHSRVLFNISLAGGGPPARPSLNPRGAQKTHLHSAGASAHK